MIIREANINDLKNLTDIYNYEVTNGVSTFDINEKSVDERVEWLNEHNKDNHPLFVADIDGEAVGYVSLSPYREKEAYRTTVELSLYVSHKYRRMGVATKLMDKIIDYAKNDENVKCVVSVITSGNEASIKIHEKYGFKFCGTIPDVGVKFGRYLSIDNFVLLV